MASTIATVRNVITTVAIAQMALGRFRSILRSKSEVAIVTASAQTSPIVWEKAMRSTYSQPMELGRFFDFAASSKATGSDVLETRVAAVGSGGLRPPEPSEL
jgi:hypothetical protein